MANDKTPKRVTLVLAGNVDNPNNNITNTMKVDRALEALRKAVQKLAKLNTESYAESNGLNSNTKHRITYVKSATKRVGAVAEVVNTASNVFNVLEIEDAEYSDSCTGITNVGLLKEIFNPDVGSTSVKRRFEKLQTFMEQARDAMERDICFETNDDKTLSKINGSMPLSLAACVDTSQWERLEKKMNHLKTKLIELNCIAGNTQTGEEEEDDNDINSSTPGFHRSGSGRFSGASRPSQVPSRPSIRASTVVSRWSGTFSNTTVESLFEDYGDNLSPESMLSPAGDYYTERESMLGGSEMMSQDESNMSENQDAEFETETSNVVQVNLIAGCRTINSNNRLGEALESYGLSSISTILGVNRGPEGRNRRKFQKNPLLLGCSLMVAFLLVIGAIMVVRSKSASSSVVSGESQSEQGAEGLTMSIDVDGEDGESHSGNTASNELEVSSNNNNATELENSEEELNTCYSDKCCCLLMTAAAAGTWTMHGAKSLVQHFSATSDSASQSDSVSADSSPSNSAAALHNSDLSIISAQKLEADEKLQSMQADIDRLTQERDTLKAENDELKLDAETTAQGFQQQIAELEKKLTPKGDSGEAPSMNNDPTKTNNPKEFCRCLSTYSICFATIGVAIAQIMLPFVPQNIWKGIEGWFSGPATMLLQNHSPAQLHGYVSNCTDAIDKCMDQLSSDPISKVGAIQKSAIFSGLSVVAGFASGSVAGCIGCFLRAVTPAKWVVSKKCSSMACVSSGKMKRNCMIGCVGVLVLGFFGNALHEVYHYIEGAIAIDEGKIHTLTQEKSDAAKQAAQKLQDQIKLDEGKIQTLTQEKLDAAKQAAQKLQDQIKLDEGKITQAKSDAAKQAAQKLQGQMDSLNSEIKHWKAACGGGLVVGGVGLVAGGYSIKNKTDENKRQETANSGLRADNISKGVELVDAKSSLAQAKDHIGDLDQEIQDKNQELENKDQRIRILEILAAIKKNQFGLLGYDFETVRQELRRHFGEEVEDATMHGRYKEAARQELKSLSRKLPDHVLSRWINDPEEMKELKNFVYLLTERAEKIAEGISQNNEESMELFGYHKHHCEYISREDLGKDADTFMDLVEQPHLDSHVRAAKLELKALLNKILPVSAFSQDRRAALMRLADQ